MITNEELLRYAAIIKKLNWYKSNNLKCFVLFKNLYGNTTFYNGDIVNVGGDEFLINDKKYGETTVEYHDIVTIDISRPSNPKRKLTKIEYDGGEYNGKYGSKDEYF